MVPRLCSAGRSVTLLQRKVLSLNTAEPPRSPCAAVTGFIIMPCRSTLQLGLWRPDADSIGRSALENLSQEQD